MNIRWPQIFFFLCMKADAEIKNDSGRRQSGEEYFEAKSVRVERINWYLH